MGTSGKRSRLIKARRRKRIILTVVAILVILIAAGLFIWFRYLRKENPEGAEPASDAATEETAASETGATTNRDGESESGATKGETIQEAVPEAKSDEDLLKLEEELNAYISGKEGDWSVCLKRTDSSKMIDINADRKMRSASLIKLYVAGCSLEAIQSGEIDQKDDIRAKIEKMLTVSDNDSCNELINLLGSGEDQKGFDRINAFIQAHNYAATVIGRKMLEQSENDNYTSAKDCAVVLEEILNGAYVDQESSDFVLECLKNQQRVNKIPSGIPEEIETANKTGELDGQMHVENDAAIVWAPGGTYILCIMSDNINNQSAVNTCVEISEMVYAAIGESKEDDNGSSSLPGEPDDTDKVEPEEAGTASASQSGKETNIASGTTGTANGENSGAAIVSERIKGLSLENKVSYLVVSSPEAFVKKELDKQGITVDGVTMVGGTTQRSLDSHPYAAGFMVSAKNVENSDQFEELIENMEEDRDEFPMLFMLSEEELRDTDFLNKLETSADPGSFLTPLLRMGTYEDASRAGREMGEFLDEYGINVYVTTDLNAINDKELPEDRDVIGGYIESLRAKGIHVCAAYFPEKGTKKDADGFSTSDKTRYELDNEDLEIMRHAVNEGVDMIMVPNTRYPEIISAGESGSMSKEVMSGMIRNDLGFSGVIITEVMNRDRLADRYTIGQAAVKALQNGADMVIVSEDYDETLDSIMEAVRSGDLTEERINEAVQRVYGMMTK